MKLGSLFGLMSACALSVMPVIDGGALMGAPLRVSGQVDPWLQVVPFGSAEFAAGVARLLGETSEPQLPYSILVRNLRDEPVIAISIQYRLTKDKDVQLANVVSDALSTLNHAPVVAPKGESLIGPGMVVTTRVGRNSIRPQFPVERLNRFATVSDIEVKIDAVLWSDGKLVGPDDSEAILGIAVRQRVASELGAKVLAMLQKTESPLPWLNTLGAEQESGGPPRGELAWARLWQGSHAAMLIRAFERGTGHVLAEQLSQAQAVRIVR